MLYRFAGTNKYTYIHTFLQCIAASTGSRSLAIERRQTARRWRRRNEDGFHLASLCACRRRHSSVRLRDGFFPSCTALLLLMLIARSLAFPPTISSSIFIFIFYSHYVVSLPAAAAAAATSAPPQLFICIRHIPRLYAQPQQPRAKIRRVMHGVQPSCQSPVPRNSTPWNIILTSPLPHYVLLYSLRW